MTDQTNIERFEQLLMSVDRDGIDKLIEFIRKSDFYTAPASTQYHSCHDGGLLEHSLNVYDCLMAKKNNPTWKEVLENVSEETLILCSLLHDTCKTYFYTTEFKNKKVYSETGSKSDTNGRFDWVSVPSYGIDDKFPYGHGEKSVMMISEYIKLTPIEKYSIRFHMGFSEPREMYNALGAAMRKYPLIIALNEADSEATYLKEKEE